MEELFPGLVRVMEERLGRFGRPLTTIVVICLALGAASWGLKLFWDNAIVPISIFVEAIFRGIPPQDWMKHTTRFIAAIVGSIVAGIFVNIWLKRRFKKMENKLMDNMNQARQLLAELDELKRHLDELKRHKEGSPT